MIASLEELMPKDSLFSGSTMTGYDDYLSGNYNKNNVTAEIKLMRPESYLIECKKIHECEHMPIEQYLLFCSFSEKKAYEYMEKMRQGERFPMIYLDYAESKQEGRHRAYAAKLLDVRKIPVLIIKKKIKII